MFRCLALYSISGRAYSSSHSRDITAFFNKNSVRYSIPIHFEDERALFGNVLELEFDLSALATNKFVLKKEGRVVGHASCCDENPPLYFKSFLSPEVKLLT
jgi:hypothetical protein